MKKRLLAGLLAFVMVFGVAPLNGLSELDLFGLRLFNLSLPDLRLPDFSGFFAAKAKAADATSGTCGDALTWSYDAQTKTLTISGSGEMTNYNINSRAPWESFRTSIQRLVIESNVTSIGSYAFLNHICLEWVTIGNSVTSIGNNAFSGCSKLRSVIIPNSVINIGNQAFYVCTGLTSVTIGNSVTNIGDQAFYYCYRLTRVTIPNSVISIGNQTFYACTGLTEIIFNAKNAADLLSESQVFMNAGSTGSCIDITFGDGVEKIPAYLFNNQPYVKTVTLTNSVKTIGRYAFQDSTGLTDIYFYGTEEEWNSIRIRDYNNCLYDSDIHYLHTHRYTDLETVPATCSEYGSVTYICECGATYEEQTPKLPHTPAKDVRENLIAATSETTGSYDSVVYCSVCSEELSRKTTVIPKTAQNPEIYTFTADKTEVVRGNTVTFTVVASSDINMIRLVDVIDGDENNPVGIGFSKASVGSGFTDNGDGTAVWIIPLTVSLSDYANENEANVYTLYYYDASVFSCNAADVESIVVNVTKYDNSAAVNEVGGEAVEPFSIINATADLGKKLTYTDIIITTTSDVTKLRLTVDGKAVTYSAKSSNVTYTDNGDGTATWVIGYRFTKAGNYEILVKSRGNSWEGCSSKTVATTIYNTAAELAAAKS